MNFSVKYFDYASQARDSSLPSTHVNHLVALTSTTPIQIPLWVSWLRVSVATWGGQIWALGELEISVLLRGEDSYFSGPHRRVRPVSCLLYPSPSSRKSLWAQRNVRGAGQTQVSWIIKHAGSSGGPARPSEFWQQWNVTRK